MIWDLLFGIPNGPADGLQALPEDDTTDPGHKNHGCDLLLDCWPAKQRLGSSRRNLRRSSKSRERNITLKPFDVGVLAFVVAKDRGKSPQSNLAIGTGASEMSQAGRTLF